MLKLKLIGTEILSVLADSDLGRLCVVQRTGSFIKGLNTLVPMTEKLKPNLGDVEALASPARPHVMELATKCLLL